MFQPRYFILYFIVLVLCRQVLSQQGVWVQQHLPGSIGYSWSRDVGGNCCIYVWPDSTYLEAYDNVSGQWHETEIATNLPWENTLAGDSVALVWSSAHLVGYSALSQGFVPHAYTGMLVGGVTGYGVGNTLACFLTTDSCYVFDAEDSQWHVHGYTPPAYGDSMQVAIYAEKDYLLVSLANRYGWIERALIVYSRHQKTFWEFNGEYFEFQLLIGGFVFYQEYTDEVNRYFGAWSAFNGQDELVEHLSPYPANVNEPNRGTTFMFQTVDDSNYPELVYYMYGYNTRHGTFIVSSVSNDYAGNHRIGVNWEVWKNGAVQSYRYVNSGEVEYYIYSGDTHSFTYVGPTNLGYDPAIATSYGPTLGDNVMMVWGVTNIMAYDLKSGNSAMATLPTPTSGYQNTVGYWPAQNSVHAYCQRPLTKKFHIYTYNRQHNTTITELIESVPEELGYGYIARFEQENVFGFLLKDSTNAFILLLYSPTADQWTRRVLNEEPAVFGSHRDYIYWTDSEGDIIIFNGISNSEQHIPFGNVSYWFYQNYVIHRDDYFVVYTSSNQFVAYSPLTNTITYYPTELFSLTQGREKLVLYESGNSKQYLAFSAFFNTFTPLILTDDDGTSYFPLPGDNTALVMTSGGFLYAFNPYGEPDDINDKISKEKHVYQYNLFQNYPNPFNPLTAISYQLSIVSQVDLSIYNILGQKVVTLVSEKKPAGTYKVIWDATGFAAGIYFYRLETDKGFKKTKKLILLN